MSKRKASNSGEDAGARRSKKRQVHVDYSEDSDDDADLTQRADIGLEGSEAEIGIVERISLKNFMCHSRLDIPFGAHVNFIMGRNGSGKSAIVTALVVGLGGKANTTNRGSTVKGFVKTGKQKAEVEIRLRNRGQDAFKPNEYGDAIVVQRIFTKEGSSSYRLLSKEGKLVSQKRDDLNQILDRFNIQVDNPVAILNQDTSRGFLNSKSPHDKYKFFLKATQLEQMKQMYAMADEEKEVAKEIIEKKEQSLPQLEKEVLEWEQKFKSLSALSDMKKKIEKLKHESAWAFVYEKEKAVLPLKKECEHEENRLPKFVQKVQESKEKVDEAVKLHKAIQDQLKAMSENVSQLRPQFEEAKAQRATLKKQARDAENVIRKITRGIQDAQREKGQMVKKIKELKKTAQYDYEAERLQREKNIEKIEQDIQALEAQRKTTDHQQEQFRAAIAKYKADDYQINQEIQALEQRKNKVNRNLNMLSEAKKDTVKRFGPYMPTLLQHINEYCRKKAFHKKPIGPLGANIKLRDPQWALAVERCLANLMLSFCCHDHHDEAILQKIFRDVCPKNQTWPSIIVSAFKDDRHDVSRYRFNHRDFPAVVDVLDIENTVIYNCLVDQRQIESVVLIADNVTARTFMDPDKNSCPAREAFTREGDQVYSRPSLRYYSTRDTRARYLTTDVEGDIQRYREELQVLHKEMAQVKSQQQQLLKDISKNKDEANKNEGQLKKIGARLIKLNEERTELKNIEDPVPVDVSTFEEEVQNLDEQLSELQSQEEDKEVEFKKIKSALGEAEEKYKQIETEMRQKAEGADPLGDELGRAQNEIELAKSNKKHYEMKLKEQEQKVSDLKTQVECQEQEILKDIARVEQRFPGRINTRRTPKNLESEINQINNRITLEEKSRGDPNEITKTYYEKKGAYKKIREEVNRNKRFIEELQKVMDSRKEQYAKFQKLIAMRAKYFFIVLLGNRNYRGKMVFDHLKQTLDIQVQPNSNEAKEIAKDMKSLSGGERSFATVCFILSLWDAMESPFRCLDEFDVFMDAVNRRISMDLMLKVADSQRGRQFIFLTPQNMGELGISVENLYIFRMPDPDRSQSVLPFEPIRQEENMEEGDH